MIVETISSIHDIPSLPKTPGAELTPLDRSIFDETLYTADHIFSTGMPFQNNEGARRLEAHENGIWHDVGHVFIIRNNENEPNNPMVLVSQRSSTMEFGQGLVDFTVSSHTHAKETPQQAVMRGFSQQFGDSKTEFIQIPFGGAAIAKTYRSIPGALNREIVSGLYLAQINNDIVPSQTIQIAGNYWIDWQRLVRSFEDSPDFFTKNLRLFLANDELRSHIERSMRTTLGMNTRSLPDLSGKYYGYIDARDGSKIVYTFSGQQELIEAEGVFNLPVLKKQNTQQSSKVSKTPELPHARLIIHNACNYDCIGCKAGGEGGYYVEPTMVTEAYGRVMDKISEYFRVGKLSGGEPTLRPDFEEVALKAREKFADLTLITNGWNLRKITETLKKIDIDTLEVSVDGATPEVFAAMRGTHKGMLPLVKQGIEKFIHEVQKPVRINFIAMKDNLHELEGVLDYAEELNRQIQENKWKGKVSVKVLERVYYEDPGYPSWESEFVQAGEPELIVGRRSGKPSIMKQPPGNFGSPEQVFELPVGTQTIVRSGEDGQVFADMCEGCPIFPCQDGLYNVALTTEGYLKMCAHRTDLYIPLFTTRTDGEKEIREITEESIENAIAVALERYSSAYFLEDGWNAQDPKIRSRMENFHSLDMSKEIYEYPRKQVALGEQIKYNPAPNL